MQQILAFKTTPVTISHKLLLPFLMILCLGIYDSFAQKFTATFEHQALVVGDLDASANFYQEILGLKEIKNETQKPTRRWFSLGGNLQLHLLADNMDGVNVNKSIHTAVAMSNFDAFIDNLRSQDITFYDWPGNVDQITTRPDGIRQVYIQDPDGYWIEINSTEK